MDERRARAAGIDVTRVQPEAGTTQTMLPGTVAVPPQQLRIVAAPAAGLVESVLVAPNEPVKAGQPIARLRSTDLLEAQRTYLQALSGEALARQRLARDEQMYREKIIAERRLLTTRADHDFARTTLQEREQMMSLLGMAEADIKELRESAQDGRRAGRDRARGWRGAGDPHQRRRTRRRLGAAVLHRPAESALGQPAGAAAAGHGRSSRARA